MKKLNVKAAVALLLFFVIGGCKNEPGYKQLRQQVMDVHDKVMADGERAVKNKMILDTLSQEKLKDTVLSKTGLDTLEEQKKIKFLVSSLDKADNDMMDWMHDFQPDIEGKSNEEAVKYFQEELVKINNLDKRYQTAIHESDVYLQKFGLKPEHDEQGHDHTKH